MDTLSFGKHLKSARKNKGLSVEYLAEKLDMSPQSIWQIESGKRATTIQGLINICNTLDASPEYFLAKDLKHSYQNLDSEYEKIFQLMLKLTPSELSRITDIVEVTIKNRGKYR